MYMVVISSPSCAIKIEKIFKEIIFKDKLNEKGIINSFELLKGNAICIFSIFKDK